MKIKTQTIIDVTTEPEIIAALRATFKPQPPFPYAIGTVVRFNAQGADISPRFPVGELGIVEAVGVTEAKIRTFDDDGDPHIWVVNGLHVDFVEDPISPSAAT